MAKLVPFVSWVSFEARSVGEDATAREELVARIGRTAVPVIVVSDEIVVG